MYVALCLRLLYFHDRKKYISNIWYAYQCNFLVVKTRKTVAVLKAKVSIFFNSCIIVYNYIFRLFIDYTIVYCIYKIT